MSLVTGYASSSESGGDHTSEEAAQSDQAICETKAAVREDTLYHSSNSSNTSSNAIVKKRKKHYSKAELKKRRNLRKGNSPWGAWSDSENDSSAADEKEEDTQLKGYHENEETDEHYDNFQDSSTFYGQSEQDYQGRGFLHPPAEVDIDFNKPPLSFKCYLPKKSIHVYSGHLNGTGALKFLPKSGHLFLSGGNDNLIKIWDIYHDRKCLRDYKGHSKPIKALDFTADGVSFLSASFDQNVTIWDTELGKVKSRLRLNSTPNDVKHHPLKPNEFIVGLSNSKIHHYDDRVLAKQGLVQVYDHHLSSILNLRYFPDGSKFISSSEDKTVRIWENQVNIPIKQISDTTQHSMPYIDIHPEHHYFCTQSMDNTIYTYGMKPKYKKHPKKFFKGHLSAGYGIGLTFSPDGHYICSGDSKSRVLIWDWTTTRLLKTINIPGNKPVTQVAWNPQETSKVICSGAMGNIYLLD